MLPAGMYMTAPEGAVTEPRGAKEVGERLVNVLWIGVAADGKFAVSTARIGSLENVRV